MTVSSTITRISYTGNGVTTAFTVPFLFYANADLTVMLGGAAQSSGFTVTGAGTGSGTVTFTSAPAVAVNVQVILTPPQTQLTNFVDGTAFPSATLDQTLDRGVQISLRLQDQTNRSLRAPDGDTSPAMLLPAAAVRANTYPVFDSNGNVSTAVTLPSGTLSTATVGAALNPQSTAEMSAGVTPTNYAYPQGDVRRYGADPNGGSDSTSAIQSAINVCRFAAGANARFVNLNDGTYKTTAPLTVYGTFGPNGILIQGNRARINSTHNGAAISFVAALTGYTSAPQLRMNAYIRGVDFNGPGIGSTSSIGVGIGDATLSTNVTANVFLYDCTIQNYYTGIFTSAGISLWFDKVNCQFNYFGMNLAYNLTVAAGPNNTNITRSTIISNTVAVVANNFPNSQIAFTNCDIEGNNVGGTQTLTPTAQSCVFTQAGEVSFLGCHLESNTGSDDIYFAGVDSSKTLNIQACEMISSSYNVVNVANGYCVVNGGRIFNSGATNNLYLSGAAPAWSSAVAYYAGANVNVAGTNYVCILANTNQTPPNGTYWTALAAFTPYAVIHGTSTIVSGTVANALWASQTGFMQGAAGQGAATGAFGSIAPPSGLLLTGKADTLTMTFNNAAGTRINYVQSLNGADMAWVAQQAFGHVFYANNAVRFYVGRGGAAQVEPGSGNTTLCGTASLNWSGGNTQVAFTVNSDERVKQQIGQIDPRVLEAWGKVNYVQYKLNTSVEQKGADTARWHTGLIAQRIKEAFESEGLNPFAYGLLCFDKWDKAETDDRDETGEPTGKKLVIHDAGEIYGIRYEEALALECAYLRSKLKD